MKRLNVNDFIERCRALEFVFEYGSDDKRTVRIAAYQLGDGYGVECLCATSTAYAIYESLSKTLCIVRGDLLDDWDLLPF